MKSALQIFDFRSFNFRPRAKQVSAYSSGVVGDSGLNSDSVGGSDRSNIAPVVGLDDESPRLPACARLNRRLNFE